MELFKIATLLCLCLIYGASTHKQSNVCKNMNDYFTIRVNTNCWYNPDVELPPALIVKKYGFYLQNYKVVTQDGYILSLFRLVHNVTDLNNTRKPILLQHGLGITGIVWLLIGEKSLAFNLLKNGFDVWISNSRGTKYSMGHLKYSPTDHEYWSFSFHEMGIYDLPAIIEQISKTNQNHEKIIYVGHSMGTTSSYIYSSLRKEHASKKLKAIISIAPVAYMKHLRTPLKLAARYVNEIENIINISGLQELFVHPELQQRLMRATCGSPSSYKTCEILHAVLAGFNFEQLAPENLPAFFNNFLSGTSLNTIKHYAQIMNSQGRFHEFDHGFEQNKILYNSSVPPDYDVSQIFIPVHLFIGKNDFLADERDADILYDKLNFDKSKRIVSKNNTYHFAHNDFVLGKHVDIFQEMLLELLRNKI